MRYFRIMDKCGLTPGMGWLTPELSEKLAQLREPGITDRQRKKLYDEIEILRLSLKDVTPVKEKKPITNILYLPAFNSRNFAS